MPRKANSFAGIRKIYGRADGKETIIIDASLRPVKDEQGNVVFITAEGRDITEKKAHEREIAQKNEELQALLLRIKELDEIKNQFFANVSHELITSLALILGPAERLLDKHRMMSPNERLESSQVIARNARMLLKHVNDLLDISKFEAVS
jgi:signal transduction histidine kinase